MVSIFRTIRTNARTNRQTIIKFLEDYSLVRENGRAKAKPTEYLCIFCGGTDNITREHVLPRWAFERHPHKSFVTTINGLQHKYNQTTSPTCAPCNNELLCEVEKEMLRLFANHQLPYTFFEVDELFNMIRWMEILDYKFQVFSLMTRFKVVAGKGPIPFLNDYPLSVLDPNIEYSPARVIQNIRRSFNRMTIRDKERQLNSLVIFKTSNPNITFFHKNNDYLFLELPKYKIALFCHFERIFPDVYTARDTTMEIIKKQY